MFHHMKIISKISDNNEVQTKREDSVKCKNFLESRRLCFEIRKIFTNQKI